MDLEIEKYKIMTFMLINSVEGALGDYLKSKGEDIRDYIKIFLKQRDKKKITEENDDPIGSLFWNELWDIAANVTKEDEKKRAFDYLKVKASNLTNARNKSHHGNRNFYVHYWFSLAAFVTSPEFEKLDFIEVKRTFFKALKGDLNHDISLTTLKEFELKTPNNLEQVSYEATGYIGRTKEKESIKNKLINSRFNSIAISGPGGVGKTALVEAVLSDLVYEDYFDAIYFVSFKENILTSGGVLSKEVETDFEKTAIDLNRFLDANLSLDKSPLALSKIYNFSDKRVCLCLDNLEELIQNRQDLLDDFLSDIPKDWKIIVTSRVKPNGFMSEELKDLDKNSSYNLGLTYLKYKGLASKIPNLKEKIYDLTQKCLYNPLAIILAIDLFAKSGELNKSIENSVSMVSNFSFTTLENFLSSITIEILEFLRQFGEATYDQIISILGITEDDFVIFSNEVNNTSMVSINLNEDELKTFSCPNMTSNFLRGNLIAEKSRAEIREKINEFGSTGTKIQNFNSTNFKSSSPYELPTFAPHQLVDLIKPVVSIFKTLKNHNYLKSRGSLPLTGELNDFIRDLDSLSTSYRNSQHYFIIRARALQILDDNTAEDMLLKAIQVSEGEAAIPYYLLGRYYFSKNQFQEAAASYEKSFDLRPSFFPSLSGVCLSLQFTNELDNILLSISMSKRGLNLHPAAVTLYMGGLKRSLEHIRSREENANESLIKELNSFLTDFRELLTEQIFKKVDEKIIVKTIGSLVAQILTIFFLESLKDKLNRNGFIDLVYFYESLDGDYSECIQLFNRTGKKDFLDYFCTLFKKDEVHKFNEFIQEKSKINIPTTFENDDITVDDRLKTGDLILCTITNRPNRRDSIGGPCNFCFCVDQNGQRYFVHDSTFKSSDWMLDLCFVGVKIAIKFKETDKEHPVATETYFYSNKEVEQ